MNKLPEEIISLYPPIVMDMPTSGHRYAIFDGKHYPVEKSFTAADAMKRWKKWTSPNKQPNKDWTWRVANSKGNGYYDVTFDAAGWSCTCTGFGFRRKCRHIDEKKKQF